jgi:hypothetical protein
MRLAQSLARQACPALMRALSLLQVSPVHACLQFAVLCAVAPGSPEHDAILSQI